MGYADKVRDLLSPAEIRLLERLSSPQKVQSHLDTLPVNFEPLGETYMSPRRLIRAKTAHCLEGAVFAAAVLAFHGEKPLLMDFRAAKGDEDHVIALYRQGGRWGSISKTNHAILRFRDPVYKSPRELAMSFYHEYFIDSGRKTMLAFSGPADLSRFKPEKWVTAGEELFWLVDWLDRQKHFPVAPKKNLKLARKASGIERAMVKPEEWTKSGRKNFR